MRRLIFIILILQISLFAKANNESVKISVKSDTDVNAIRLAPFSKFSPALAFFSETIRPSKVCSFKMELNEPIVCDIRLISGRKVIGKSTCYLEPGKELMISVKKGKLEIKGELEKKNHFISDLISSIRLAGYEELRGTNYSLLNKIDSFRIKKKIELKNSTFSEEFKKNISGVIDWNTQAIKIKVLTKNMHLGKQVIEDCLKTFIDPYLSTTSVMSNEDYLIVLKNYFLLNEYCGRIKYKDEGSKEIEQLAWIKNEYVRNWYALNLSAAHIHKGAGITPYTIGLLKELERSISLENEKLVFQRLMERFNKMEKEFSGIYNGKAAPEFTFENHKGEKVSLSDFKGKYVLLDFWNIHCGPCIKQIPFLKKYEEEFKDLNLEVVSISCDGQEEKEQWRKFVIKREMSGHQLIMDKGRDSKILSDYAIGGFPTFVLIDPDGNIASSRLVAPANRSFKSDLLKIIRK